ncbi:glycosyltransferase [Listeria grandensis]|uniref:Glycosyltransferase n=1 Tax=Listeria grandensis TaxID=1494963 RepID=A0A7X1CPH6_9LIST|nr:glycosyltransferase [Listeria grandensis]MBC1936009.1 glycosyltransferase [Listeria grandensis]
MCNVSVILPVYNVAPYLAECLESLIAQTYQDFEVIAVNDGSSDGSLAILEAYQAKLPQLSIISQRNQGLSAARNTGLKSASGKYLYFLDSDDYVQKNMLERCFTLAEQQTLDVVKFDAEPFTEDGVVTTNPYDSRAFLKEKKLYTQQKWLEVQRFRYNSPVWLCFIRAALVFQHNLQFVEGILHEDEIFTPQLFMKAERVMYIGEMFFKRRYRQGSIMQNNIYGSRVSYDSKRRVIQLLHQEMQRKEVTKEAKRFLRQRRNVLYVDSLHYDKELRVKTSFSRWVSYPLAARTCIRQVWKRSRWQK